MEIYTLITLRNFYNVKVAVIDQRPYFVAQDVMRAIGVPKKEPLSKFIDEDDFFKVWCKTPAGDKLISVFPWQTCCGVSIYAKTMKPSLFRKRVEKVVGAFKRLGIEGIPVKIEKPVSSKESLLQPVRRIFQMTPEAKQDTEKDDISSVLLSFPGNLNDLLHEASESGKCSE